ncbi:MAG: butyrate kinase [Elusimicrobiota bacterium]|jgi:butyrate kinase|nr:butyrate kinase [Elusimicrobiota bacterium]
MSYNILVINPGSTSDDIGYYRGQTPVFELRLDYSTEDLAPFENKNIAEMAPLKKKVILEKLKEYNIPLSEINAVAGRGGLTKPIEGGAYYVNDLMLEDLKSAKYGVHASNLGGILAREIADEAGCISLISDAVVVDELNPLARYTGMPELKRIAIAHALNQRRVAFLTAKKLGKPYEDCRFVIMHAGGGVSIGVHIGGKIVDVNNALEGEGPMSPQRSGTLPVADFARLCYSGKYTFPQMYLKIKGRGGLFAYTGTQSMKDVREFAETGKKPAGANITCTREQAQEIIDAMIYQFMKYIGYMAAVAEGKLDGVILTGGLMYGESLREALKQKVSWIAPVFVYPGSDEKAALREAAVRALDNPAAIKEYK